MPLCIRMARAGTKKKPFFHLVVADNDFCRDGRYIERVGTYNPKAKGDARANLDLAKIEAWVKKGAQVSETVGHLVKAASKSK